MRITLVERGTTSWSDSARLVGSVFSRSFGAQVAPDPDYFLSCLETDADGVEQVLATAALTLPESGSLYVERYLDVPIEQAIAAHGGHGCLDRRDILQLGSVASTRATAGVEVMKAVPLVLLCLGRTYAAMTITKRVSLLLQRIGVVFNQLTWADPYRLGHLERERWGTYYEHRPVVGYCSSAEQTDLLTEAAGRYRVSSVDIRLVTSSDKELSHVR